MYQLGVENPKVTNSRDWTRCNLCNSAYVVQIEASSTGGQGMRDASFCSRQKLLQTPTTGPNAETM